MVGDLSPSRRSFFEKISITLYIWGENIKKCVTRLQGSERNNQSDIKRCVFLSKWLIR